MTTFAQLHTGPLPLLLPNAWDLTSALVLVADGYPAIGTTSFGVAAGIGRPDGARSTRAANLALAAQLAPLPVHVTIDIEDGYSDDDDEVAELVAELHDVGVVGVNVEDSVAGRLVDPRGFAAKVATIKEANPEVFVNARVDTYWFHEDDNPEATLARATAYQDAGADGVFLPGATDPDLLRTITRALDVPVNVLPVPGRTLAELGELGVRRISTGSLPYRAAIQAATLAAAAIRDGVAPPPSIPYDTLQAVLTSHSQS